MSHRRDQSPDRRPLNVFRAHEDPFFQQEPYRGRIEGKIAAAREAHAAAREEEKRREEEERIGRASTTRTNSAELAATSRPDSMAFPAQPTQVRRGNQFHLPNQAVRELMHAPTPEEEAEERRRAELFEQSRDDWNTPGAERTDARSKRMTFGFGSHNQGGGSHNNEERSLSKTMRRAAMRQPVGYSSDTDDE